MASIHDRGTSFIISSTLEIGTSSWNTSFLPFCWYIFGQKTELCEDEPKRHKNQLSRSAIIKGQSILTAHSRSLFTFLCWCSFSHGYFSEFWGVGCLRPLGSRFSHVSEIWNLAGACSYGPSKWAAPLTGISVSLISLLKCRCVHMRNRLARLPTFRQAGPKFPVWTAYPVAGWTILKCACVVNGRKF